MENLDKVIIVLIAFQIIATLVLIVLNMSFTKQDKKAVEKEKTETSSRPISLGGLSETLLSTPPINDDSEIIQKLEEKEQAEKISAEQQEILKLMTSNREQTQYKDALARTIKDIRSGNTHEGN